MGKQRLRMKDLVTEVFLYLSRKYDQSEESSISQMVTPMEEIRAYLNEKYSISYTSNQHIYNQLRSYEEEQKVQLFRKVRLKSDPDNLAIALEEHLEGYKQKQLLYLSQKIKIANAVFEKILHETENRPFVPLKVLLGAGTEVYYVAEAIVAGIREKGMKFQIYTHNLGVVDYLMAELPGLEGLELYTRYDWVDPVNNILIGTGQDHYDSVGFDYIIQAATYVSDGKLYLDSPRENIQKKEILSSAKGEKILVLTRHEFISEELKNTEPYGSLDQYDYIITPFSRGQGGSAEYEQPLAPYIGRLIEPDITHYNYRVYRVIK